MNVDWIHLLPSGARRALYFTLQRLAGSNIEAAWRQLLAWEKLPAQTLDQKVDQALTRTLQIALDQSPYYRSLGIHSDGRSGRALLARFPILTREIIQERFADIVVDPLRSQIPSPEARSSKRYDWLVVKTGGTTGMPTAVVHDAQCRDWGRACRLYTQRQCGIPLGTPYFRLWGSEQDLLQQQESFPGRLLRSVTGEIPLNAFRAREEDLWQHYHTIQKNPHVRHLMAYADAANALTTFIQDRGLVPPQFDTVMSTAGTLLPEWRQQFQKTYNGAVFDKYGSRECTEIACECSAHSGLHILSPNVFVEVIDDSGKSCSPGQVGRILVTLLRNHSFPMIRYDIGDLGELAPAGPCPCGLPFPKLQSLQGRPDDMLLTEDGTLLSSVFIRHFVGVACENGTIREWQFEQTAPKEFVFRYVVRQKAGQPNLDQLKESVHKALGASVLIHFTQVDAIPQSATGKTLWVINRLRKRAR